MVEKNTDWELPVGIAAAVILVVLSVSGYYWCKTDNGKGGGYQ